MRAWVSHFSVNHWIYISKLHSCLVNYIFVLDKRNTAWLRDTVRQTSLRPCGRWLPLGTSTWPYRVTTQYSYFIKHVFAVAIDNFANLWHDFHHRVQDWAQVEWWLEHRHGWLVKRQWAGSILAGRLSLCYATLHWHDSREVSPGFPCGRYFVNYYAWWIRDETKTYFVFQNQKAVL